MAKLEGARIIDPSKIVDYLLNPAHTKGGAGKAKFLMAFGFSGSNPTELEMALHQHAVDRDIDSVENDEFGIVTVLKCALKSPDGRDPCVKTVWIKSNGQNDQRLVTAFPA